jgi:hypothetical protein
MILGQRRVEASLQIAVAPVADVMGQGPRRSSLGDGPLAGAAAHEAGQDADLVALQLRSQAFDQSGARGIVRIGDGIGRQVDDILRPQAAGTDHRFLLARHAGARGGPAPQTATVSQMSWTINAGSA